MWGVKSRSSEPKFLFPGLHLAFSDEYITIALSMCILLPFLSQSYHEVLGSKEESKEEGSFQSTVCLGKNFLPVDRFLCLVVMYNPGLEGKKKNLCLYSYFSPWFTVWFWPNHLASLGLSVSTCDTGWAIALCSRMVKGMEMKKQVWLSRTCVVEMNSEMKTFCLWAMLGDGAVEVPGWFSLKRWPLTPTTPIYSFSFDTWVSALDPPLDWWLTASFFHCSFPVSPPHPNPLTALAIYGTSWGPEFLTGPRLFFPSQTSFPCQPQSTT